MGFLSKVWGGIKNVFTGILKVFEPILKPIGKLLNSSFGKALMIGLSIFTLGSAMIAGAGAFSSTLAAGGPGSFINAFVEGGKVFMQTLTGMGGQGGGKELAKEGASAAVEGATASQAATEASNLAVAAGGSPELVGQGASALEGASQITQGANQAVQQAGQLGSGGGKLSQAADMSKTMAQGGGLGPTQAMAETGVPLSQVKAGAEAAGKAGWLEKAKSAGKAFVDYTKSPGGSQIVGSLIEGAGNYYTEKDRQEFEDRVRRDWMSGDKSAGVRDARAQSARVGSLQAPDAQGIARASRATANEEASRPYWNYSTGGAGG